MNDFGPDSSRSAGRDEPATKLMAYDVENAVLTLDAGFTTIQSPGAMADKDLRDISRAASFPARACSRCSTPSQKRADTSQTSRAGARAKTTRRRPHQDLRVQEHPRRRRADDDRRTAPGGLRRSEALGLRTIVHAHSASSAKAATLAGCTAIEHGAYITDEVFDLMASTAPITTRTSGWCCRITSRTNRSILVSATTTKKDSRSWRRASRSF